MKLRKILATVAAAAVAVSAMAVSAFAATTVNVEGANGFTAKEYNVYTYVPNAAFGNTDTLKITLQ